jgi:hypothetical protein
VIHGVGKLLQIAPADIMIHNVFAVGTDSTAVSGIGGRIAIVALGFTIEDHQILLKAIIPNVSIALVPIAGT